MVLIYIRAMQKSAEDTFRYDRRTIGLHWTVAVIVALLWCLGQSIDWFPRGTPRVSVRSAHIVLGVLLLALVLVRLWWRLTGGRRLPPQARGAAQRAAWAGHVLLYALSLAGMVLGLTNVWVRGDTIFQLFSDPQIRSKQRKRCASGARICMRWRSTRWSLSRCCTRAWRYTITASCVTASCTA